MATLRMMPCPIFLLILNALYKNFQMKYHLFQKFFGKMVKIKEMSFLSTKGMGLMFGNCIGVAGPSISKILVHQTMLDGSKYLKILVWHTAAIPYHQVLPPLPPHAPSFRRWEEGVLHTCQSLELETEPHQGPTH